MSLDDEITKIEAMVNGCEKDLENKAFSSSTITSRMLDIADPAARAAKGNVLADLLTERCESIDIERLLELKKQYPNDPRVGNLGHRAADYCSIMQDITLSAIQTIDSPSDETLKVKNQALAIKDVMAYIKSLFSEGLTVPAQPALPAAETKEEPAPPDDAPPQREAAPVV